MKGFFNTAMRKSIITLLIILVTVVIVFNLTKKQKSVPIIKPVDNTQTNPSSPPAKSEDLAGKQVIVFAFDGSKALDMWQDSLDFAQKMTSEGKPIHFTYFISGVYLITYANKTLYQPPIFPAGTSKIGFGDSKADVIKRINYINRAVAEGHEIGSHLNGHFDATTWTTADWQQEFDQFDKLVTNVNVNNAIDPAVAKLNISQKDIAGFRAPNLARNEALWPILTSHNFIYDTSTTGKLGDWPKKENGLWKFAIPSIKYSNTSYNLLSMDYNFYLYQTSGTDLYKKGTDQWQKAFDDMYTSYINYFDNNYNSTKAPVFIAHHFSKWNDGVYWEALQKFAETECGKADVRCITYKELTDYLNTKK
jgi:peptidoglycan/xylan/chitin deacetylase (PgdA/CDA1 family)